MGLGLNGCERSAYLIEAVLDMQRIEHERDIDVRMYWLIIDLSNSSRI